MGHHEPEALAARVRTDARPELAEAVGTFLMMLAGGAAILAGQPAAAVAAAFGVAVLVLVYALGHVSGAHFNPAITLAFALTRHFPWRRVPGFVAAQVLGAVAASVVLAAWAPVDPAIASGSLAGLPGSVVEALATFLLAFVIIAVATDGRAAPGVAGLAVGSSVFLGALVAGPLSGAAMNPARTIGPALVAGTTAWGEVLLHVMGPIVGAIAGMFAYEGLRPASRPTRGESLGVAGPVELEAP